MENPINIYETFNTVNIGSNLETDGMLKTNDVYVNGIL